MKFALGLLVGLILGATGVAIGAGAPKLSGAGFLMGWFVYKDGQVICRDPYLYEVVTIIECV